MKVKIADIARELGLSIGTVDRALHNRPDINSATRDLIQAKAAEMGYVTNRAASSLSRKEPHRFVAMIPTGKGFYGPVEEGILAAAHELKDFNVIVEIRKNKVWAVENNDEVAILERVLEERVSGLLISPSHHPKIKELLGRLRARQVPVVAVSNDIEPDYRDGSVVADGFVAGEMAADLLTSMMGSEGKIAILPGFMSVFDHQQKIAGFQKALTAYSSQLQIVGVYETQDDVHRAEQATMAALNEHPDLGGIYVCSASGHGVAAALTRMDPFGKVRLVTTDILPEFHRYFQANRIQATLWQDPFRQGLEAMRLLYNLSIGTPVANRQKLVQPVIVTKHVLRYYSGWEFDESLSTQAALSDVTRA